MSELYVENGPLEGKTYLLSPERPSLLIGRSDGGVQVDIDCAPYGGAVSRRHAQVRLDSRGVIVVSDLGSRNGTYVDDQRIQLGDELPLDFNSRLHIAPPDGPCFILRQRASAWDGADEELEILRRDLRELRAAFEGLRRERDELAGRLMKQGGGAAPADAGGGNIDWPAVQRALALSKTQLAELRALFADLQIDGRAQALLLKIQTSMGNISALLKY